MTEPHCILHLPTISHFIGGKVSKKFRHDANFGGAGVSRHDNLRCRPMQVDHVRS